MRRNKFRTLAAIHIGSELVSLQIVEYRDLEKIKIVEQEQQHSSLSILRRWRTIKTLGRLIGAKRGGYGYIEQDRMTIGVGIQPDPI